MSYKSKHSIEQMRDALSTDIGLQVIVDNYLAGETVTVAMRTELEETASFIKYRDHLLYGDAFIPINSKADVPVPNKWPENYNKLDPHTKAELYRGQWPEALQEIQSKAVLMGIDWGMGADKTVLATLELSQDEVQRRIAAGLGVPEEYLKPKPAALSEFNDRLTDAIYKKKMQDRFERQFTPVEQVPPSEEPKPSKAVLDEFWKQSLLHGGFARKVLPPEPSGKGPEQWDEQLARKRDEPELKDPLHRRLWKEMRFSRSFGMSWERLEEMVATNIGLGAAKGLIEKFKRTYPEAAKYTDHKDKPLIDVDYSSIERRIMAAQAIKDEEQRKAAMQDIIYARPVAVDLETQDLERHRAALRAPIFKPRIQGAAADLVGPAIDKLIDPEPTDPEKRALWKIRNFGATYSGQFIPPPLPPFEGEPVEQKLIEQKTTHIPPAWWTEARDKHIANVKKMTQDMQDHELKRAEAIIRQVYGTCVITIEASSVSIQDEYCMTTVAGGLAQVVALDGGKKEKQVVKTQQVGPGDVDEEDPNNDVEEPDDVDKDYVDPEGVEPEPDPDEFEDEEYNEDVEDDGDVGL